MRWFKTLFVFLNEGFDLSDIVAAQAVKKNESELGDPPAFLAGAYRSVMQAYVPD